MTQKKLNGTLVSNHLNLDCIHDDLSYLSIQVPRKLRLIKQIESRIEQKKNILECYKKAYLRENKPNLQQQKRIFQIFEELQALSLQKCAIANQFSNAVKQHIPVIEKQINNLNSFIKCQTEDAHHSPKNSSIYQNSKGGGAGGGGEQVSKRQPPKRTSKSQNLTESIYGSLGANSRQGNMNNNNHNNNISSSLPYQSNNKLSNSFYDYDSSLYESKAVQSQKQEVYCYCRKPASYDENMIACDAEGCEIEWFHIKCVFGTNAEQQPDESQKWICPICKSKNAEYKIA